MSDRPLDGIVVLDLTITIPGPYATHLLQRMGARIIKLEPPGGDITRMTPGLHDAMNVGKESVTVNLKDPHDQALARAIAARADVVVEGWRPGVAARLGVGYEVLREINPALVYCSISGFGADGPLVARAGHDINYLAITGMTQVMFGERPPQAIDLPMADLAGGTFAALRIAAALVAAKTAGRGCHIDASLAGAVREWVDAIGARGTENPAAGLGALPHYGIFRTADGAHLSIGIVQEDHFWRNLCGVLGVEGFEDLGFIDRWGRADEIRPVLATAIEGRSRRDLESALSQTDTCWAFIDPPGSDDPIGGRLPALGGDIPAAGQHTEAIRAEFGVRAQA